jgi:hypothetical protein
LNKTPKQLLLAILENTNNETTTIQELKEKIRITNESIRKSLYRLNEKGLISEHNGEISLSLNQRIKIAIKAIESGVDFQKVSNYLGWLEFEEFVAHIFEENKYIVFRRYRFQAEGRRWEIDVLAIKSPHIICAECKHWSKRIGNNTARKIIESHLEKTEVFSKNIEDQSKKIGVYRWKNAIITPITLTLSPTKLKIYRRMPSVSVFALPNFIDEYMGHLERLVHFKVDIPEFKPKPRQTRLR